MLGQREDDGRHHLSGECRGQQLPHGAQHGVHPFPPDLARIVRGTGTKPSPRSLSPHGGKICRIEMRHGEGAYQTWALVHRYCDGSGMTAGHILGDEHPGPPWAAGRPLSSGLSPGHCVVSAPRLPALRVGCRADQVAECPLLKTCS
jgi:hypothetical protein